MSIEPMSEDEFAAHVRESGTNVVQIRGVYWAEQRPFFFRPLLPFTEVAPDHGNYPARSWLGGVQHVVPDASPANSTKQYFVYEHPQSYRIDALPHPRANKIRKGLKIFEWRRNTDHASFVEQAYPVYLSFAGRTAYAFMQERRHRRHFSAWARSLFAHPKVVVCSAHAEGRLCAVSIFFLVGQTLINGVYFSDTESQRLQVHDFVLHQLREEAAGTAADLIYMGPHTGVEGIDRAKEIRGCTLITKRTHLRINPLVGAALKRFNPRIHARLQGRDPKMADTGDGQASSQPAKISPSE